jgi:radical SAM protein with 4Fe4S-binding SPASM domain
MNKWALLRDTYKYLDFQKVKGSLQLWRSYNRSKRSGIAELNSKPFAISIEPTTACNLGCPECPSGLRQFNRKTGNLKVDLFKKVIDQMKEHLIYLTFYFQGEPYINPDFLDMVKYANKSKIYTSTSTNAHFLNKDNAIRTIESGLDKLIVSVDGTTQETYEKYRINGDLNKALGGIREIVKWKAKLKSNKPKVVMQFLVVKHNEHQINEAKKLAKNIGADSIQFKTAQIYDYANGSPLIPEQEKYSRYKMNRNGKYEIKNSLSNQCWRMWHSCVITWDGQVVPCCFDKDAKYQLGDLSIQSFDEIWYSENYMNFRNSILKSRKQVDICTNCTEGTKVWTS